MKTRKRLSFSEPKNSAESSPRRSTLRKRQRTEHVSEGGSDGRGDSESEPMEEVTSHSDKDLHSWPVTCGNKKGSLHITKMEQGQTCIESEGCWFSPRGFEKFGGKAASKKWKISIFYKDWPLQYWIENGDLPPISRRHFAACEMSYNESSPSTESDENSSVDKEDGPAEDQEEQQTNGTKTPSELITMKRPMLILHKLEHLQGDFHLLLNNVLLPQQGSPVPKEKLTETTMEDEYVGADVGSEPPEQILAQDNSESDCAAKEEETDEKIADCAAKEEETDEKIAPCTEEPAELQNVITEHEEDTSSSAEECNDEITEGTSEIVENIILTLENEDSEEDTQKMDDTEKSSEPQEETAQNSPENEEPTLTEEDSSAAEAPNVSESEIQQQPVESPTTEPPPEEVTSPDVNETAQLHQQLTERSSTVTSDEAAPAQTSPELDTMDLEQLQREKLKMQLKVLKLKEAYYTLQLKKMNQ